MSNCLISSVGGVADRSSRNQLLLSASLLDFVHIGKGGPGSGGTTVVCICICMGWQAEDTVWSVLRDSCGAGHDQHVHIDWCIAGQAVRLVTLADQALHDKTNCQPVGAAATQEMF